MNPTVDQRNYVILKSTIEMLTLSKIKGERRNPVSHTRTLTQPNQETLTSQSFNPTH